MQSNLVNALEKIRGKHQKRLNQPIINLDGGPGSGHWGHAGREGERGGSVKGTGGGSHRYKDKDGNYTSFAKTRRSLAQPHKPSYEELKASPKGTKLIIPHATGTDVYIKESGQVWKQISGDGDQIGKLISGDDDVYGTNLMHTMVSMSNVKLAMPKEDVDVSAFMEKYGAVPTGGKNSKKVSPFMEDYPTERYDNATVYTNRWDADDDYRAETGKIWKSLSTDERDSLCDYTLDSEFMNAPLRHKQYHEFGGENSLGAINAMTKAIDQTGGLKQDTMLYRGIASRYSSICSLFKLPASMADAIEKDPSILIGMTGKEDAFMSCGISEGTGLKSKIKAEIFAPKGTKGLYVEPFSECGAGQGRKWDGKATQTEIGNEQEYILQRGTSVKVTGVYKDYSGSLVIQCSVVGQDYSDNPAEKIKEYIY